MKKELTPTAKGLPPRESPLRHSRSSLVLVTAMIIAPGVDDMMAERHDDANFRTATVMIGAMIGVVNHVVFLAVPGLHAKLYLRTGKGGSDHPCNQQH